MPENYHLFDPCPPLRQWQELLLKNYTVLRESVGGEIAHRRIFALEHGLDQNQLRQLCDDARHASETGQLLPGYFLPWVVYATELGYEYSGSEYWQTFALQVGNAEQGMRRFILNCFKRFHREFGCIAPSGLWAMHFNIISWPITNAVLPQDLQVKFAQVLYDVRHRFSAALFDSPTALGELIRDHSQATSSRFRTFVHGSDLVGHIAAALLLSRSDHVGSSILSEDTLARIISDLSRHQQAREWLRVAQSKARAGLLIRGTRRIVRSIGRTERLAQDEAKEEVEALDLKPSVLLQLEESGHWSVYLEFPSFAPLLRRFPDLRESLSTSQYSVPCAENPNKSRGWLLWGSQKTRLESWPNAGSQLLSFSRSCPLLDSIVGFDSMLPNRPMRLFRVTAEGIAEEVASLSVRPSRKYILLCFNQSLASGPYVRSSLIDCQGLLGYELIMPQTIDTDLQRFLKENGLSLASKLEVKPIAVAPSLWDGEGRLEYLTTDHPVLAIIAESPIDQLDIAGPDTALELSSADSNGDLVWYLSLGRLSEGLHKYKLSAFFQDAAARTECGTIEVAIRDPEPWISSSDKQAGLMISVRPPSTNLYQLLSGDCDIEVLGPIGQRVKCKLEFFRDSGPPPERPQHLKSFILPMPGGEWKKAILSFVENFHEGSLDEIDKCRVTFSSEELGRYSVEMEREFTPLRWTARKEQSQYRVFLHSELAQDSAVQVEHYSFAEPDNMQKVHPETCFDGIYGDVSGGLYSAESGGNCSPILVPPTIRNIRDMPLPRLKGHTPNDLKELVPLMWKWTVARLIGGGRGSNAIYLLLRMKTLQTICAEISSLLCGITWRIVEEEAQKCQYDVLLERINMVSHPSNEELEIRNRIYTASRRLVLMSPKQRVEELNRILKNRIDFTAPAGTNFEWVTELILRLLSGDPHVASWCQDRQKLLFVPTTYNAKICRFARLMVITVNACGSQRIGSGARVYSEWDWED